MQVVSQSHYAAESNFISQLNCFFPRPDQSLVFWRGLRFSRLYEYLASILFISLHEINLHNYASQFVRMFLE